MRFESMARRNGHYLRDPLTTSPAIPPTRGGAGGPRIMPCRCPRALLAYLLSATCFTNAAATPGLGILAIHRQRGIATLSL